MPNARLPVPIPALAASLGIPSVHLHLYGRGKAKVDPAILKGPRLREGAARLVLVSAMTPTPAGEGKTTTTIGLGQALARLGRSVCLALREPSMGPCMGIKGGGTGGGRSHLVPSEDIILHFTGDLHAVTSAHNLVAAMLDNHLHFDNTLEIDPRRVLWRRVMDMNDRALRQIVIGLGGPMQGVPRESGFDITATSEVMAMLCLAEGVEDMRARVDRAIVALTVGGAPVTIGQLGATGAVLALLRDAMMPNLVQSCEGVPAFVHGGPFANIAHGCNSVLATRCALHLADWCVTEAGFGFDLGGEKFFDIKCQSAGLDTAAVVCVATVRALKMHGGVPLKELSAPDPEAVRRGLPNLERHLDSIGVFGERPIVALNRFEGDQDDEIAVVKQRCNELGVPLAVSRHFERGGEGAMDLARLVIAHAEQRSSPFTPLYTWEMGVRDKIRRIATQIYGAKSVIYTSAALKDLETIDKLGLSGLPVCVAKTQKSLSDDPARLGRPENFKITVRNIQINAGAGFLVVLTGDIVRMPGLSRRPQAEEIDLVDGQIVGLT